MVILLLGGYQFTASGIYGANFREFICIIIASRLLNMLSTEPTDINPTPLTHILYAFANIQSDGTIILTDSYADE